MRCRSTIVAFIGIVFGFATGAFGAPQASTNVPASGMQGRDLIRRENAKPGTRDWMLTNTYIDPDTLWRSPGIEGYCSATSVSAGDTLKIMVSTNPVSEFSLEIFRTGYYGGTGGRLMGGRTGGVGGGDWTCAKPDHWLYEGTGMKEGDAIKGLVGWEWHGSPLLDLPGMEILAKGEAKGGDGKPKTPHGATIYDGPKGNIVFNAATIWCANGLSSPPGHANPIRHGVTQQGVDKRVQQITHNLFQRMIAPGV